MTEEKQNDLQNDSQKKYHIGLDIGTGSVGVAVIDDDYKPIRVLNKAGLFVRLFDSAETAQTRRGFRVIRRRMKRRKARIAMLNDLLRDAVEAKDPTFFRRLETAQLFADDRNSVAGIADKHTLFHDADFDDTAYHRRFPTVYHLRKHLMTHPEPDIRLVYLGIHHILKYRGNFLHPNFSSTSDAQAQADDWASLFESLVSAWDATHAEEDALQIDADAAQSIGAILSERNVTRRDLKARVLQQLGDKDKAKEQIAAAISGSKFDCAKMWRADDAEDESADAPSVKLEGDFHAQADDKYEELLGACGDRADVVQALKAIYDTGVMRRMLGDSAFLSDAMIARFAEHAKQRNRLRAVLRAYADEQTYAMVFDERLCDPDHKIWEKLFPQLRGCVGKQREKEFAKVCKPYENLQYFSLIGHGNLPGCKRVARADFYKAIEKLADTLAARDPDRAEEIADEFRLISEAVAQESFLLTQTDKDNGVFPYQLHECELRAILEMQRDTHPILSETDRYGSVADKLCKLLTFRVPYYVGPLNDRTVDGDSHPFAWVKRHAGKERVNPKPWEFDEVVDRRASRQEFIRRMASDCAYLPGCKALPRHSLLYEEYAVLSEIHNLRLGEQKDPLDAVDRDAIWQLCKREKRVGYRKVREALQQLHGNVPIKLSDEETGKTALDNSLSAYHAFKRVLGDRFEYPDGDPALLAALEDIVLWITALQDAQQVRESIEEHYAHLFDEREIAQLSRLSFKGWGRLSDRLLDGIAGMHCETGEVRTVIGVLRGADDGVDQHAYHLNELLEGKTCPWNFRDAIETYKREHSDGARDLSTALTYADSVADLACSPAIKRAIWQALRMVDEIVFAMRRSPRQLATISIEMARGEDGTPKGKRTISRKDRLTQLYQAFTAAQKKYRFDWFTPELGDAIQGEDSSFNDRLQRDDKLYLYYLQNGRCMYSGETIDLSQLDDCEIDHIVPRSLTTDNSLDNRVLVYRTYNQRKGDSRTVPKDIRDRMRKMWGEMKQLGSYCKGIRPMTAEKYRRLTRAELRESDLVGFLNRQLVETRQIVKHVKDILQQRYREIAPDVRILCPKANIVSNVRKSMHWDKCRDYNVYHHAHDAYLNILAGRFCHRAGMFEQKNFVRYQMNRYLKQNAAPDEQTAAALQESWKQDTAGIVANSICRELRKDGGKLRDTVERYLYGREILVTKKMTEVSGQFYDQQPLRASDGELRAIKTADKRYLRPDGTCALADTRRYGGYCTLTNTYYAIARCRDRKGKEKQMILPVPLLFARQLRDAQSDAKQALAQYYMQKLDCAHVEIVVPKIRTNSEIKLNGYRFFLAGNNWHVLTAHNATPLLLGDTHDARKRYAQIVSRLFQIVERMREMSKKSKNDDALQQRLERIAQPRYAKDGARVFWSISEQESLELFDALVDKMTQAPYAYADEKKQIGMGSAGDDIRQRRDRFEQLSIDRRISVLATMIGEFRLGAAVMDLTDLGLAKNAGKIQPGVNITGKTCVVTERSACGLYARELFRI